MKQVEYWQWYIWDLTGAKKHATRYRMDEATALARHPEATRVPNTMVMQNIAETDEERYKDCPGGP